MYRKRFICYNWFLNELYDIIIFLIFIIILFEYFFFVRNFRINPLDLRVLRWIGKKQQWIIIIIFFFYPSLYNILSRVIVLIAKGAQHGFRVANLSVYCVGIFSLASR